MKITQNDKVLRHMQDNGSISSLEAFTEYGITRLSARIADLKALGYAIRSQFETGKNRYGDTVSYVRYSLEDVK